MDTVPDLFATAKSIFPSLLKSAWHIDDGFIPEAKSVFGLKQICAFTCLVLINKMTNRIFTEKYKCDFMGISLTEIQN